MKLISDITMIIFITIIIISIFNYFFPLREGNTVKNDNTESETQESSAPKDDNTESESEKELSKDDEVANQNIKGLSTEDNVEYTFVDLNPKDLLFNQSIIIKNQNEIYKRNQEKQILELEKKSRMEQLIGNAFNSLINYIPNNIELQSNLFSDRDYQEQVRREELKNIKQNENNSNTLSSIKNNTENSVMNNGVSNINQSNQNMSTETINYFDNTEADYKTSNNEPTIE